MCRLRAGKQSEMLVMDVVWTPAGTYRRMAYDSEADLEAAIIQVQTALFGPTRMHLDVKKRIGSRPAHPGRHPATSPVGSCSNTHVLLD